MRAIAIAVLAAALAGCATGASRPPGTVSDPRPGADQSVPGLDVSRADAETAVLRDERQPGAEATLVLLAQSRDQRSAGDLTSAVATVERALGIAPDDPVLWLELAEIHLAQGDSVLAEEMARKVLTLTGANTMLAARARRIINL